MLAVHKQVRMMRPVLTLLTPAWPHCVLYIQTEQMQQYKPRVLVYNGDVDPGCNYLWAEASVEKFGLAVKAKGDWHPWVYGDQAVGEQLGGFVTEYEGGVSLATVHGAGHMSPQWRPEAAFNMVSRFLQEKPL